jgi:hypothetical protein
VRGDRLRDADGIRSGGKRPSLPDNPLEPALERDVRPAIVTGVSPGAKGKRTAKTKKSEASNSGAGGFAGDLARATAGCVCSILRTRERVRLRLVRTDLATGLSVGFRHMQ